ncbi:hypothetical protein CONPUDRAFT_167492 [Coniophora puteana RWD-64-598 SS2]|uniref:Uncharacterized protein n=1 Tax=Coniophora puteana (strain RWD-64-598) TaxID=741705 RepID=A0A5M3MIP2_CONPW|nr:uncharacterized protein CONPUDRAFT_167492 [Coniophora puteana RWD-64-598 SS2]EIW78491.1 hypothetical protein CONPUDRAFT_167492 [Coniophora puteana RWD-64-598 SS2]
MSSRAFTVFQDIPAEISKPARAKRAAALKPASSPVVSTSLSTLASIEKENLHPVTGTPAGPGSNSNIKKRKASGVLASKIVTTPATTAPSKKDKDAQPRKPSSSKGKSSEGRKSSKKVSSRKASSTLSIVDEKNAPNDPTTKPLSQATVEQAVIDSKCYEFTVSPLADVSRAFDITSPTDGELQTREMKNDLPTAIRDYFSPSLGQHSSTTDRDSSEPAAPEATTTDQTTLSTPERKKLYSSFTFSSPSPSSPRSEQQQLEQEPAPQ